MVSLDITITLPDELAQQAKAKGLLTPQAIEQLIDAELARQRNIDELFASIDRLAAANIPPMTNDELNAEIRAARAERRAQREHRP